MIPHQSVSLKEENNVLCEQKHKYVNKIMNRIFKIAVVTRAMSTARYIKHIYFLFAPRNLSIVYVSYFAWSSFRCKCK